jgi:hypothetical protein
MKQRRYVDTPRIAQAVDELISLILGRYPNADLTVSEGEDPDGVYITAMVDIEDPDEVTDFIIERTMTLQIDEQLPVYVIPIRAPRRTDLPPHRTASIASRE